MWWCLSFQVVLRFGLIWCACQQFGRRIYANAAGFNDITTGSSSSGGCDQGWPAKQGAVSAKRGHGTLPRLKSPENPDYPLQVTLLTWMVLPFDAQRLTVCVCGNSYQNHDHHIHHHPPHPPPHPSQPQRQCKSLFNAHSFGSKKRASQSSTQTRSRIARLGRRDRHGHPELRTPGRAGDAASNRRN